MHRSSLERVMTVQDGTKRTASMAPPLLKHSIRHADR